MNLCLLAATLGSSCLVAAPQPAPGDLFLGFRSVPATQCYLVNIGQASQFTNPARDSIVLSVGNIEADLIALFGSDWATQPELFWGVFGTAGFEAPPAPDPARTLYATRQRLDPGVQSTPWVIASSVNRAAAMNRMLAANTAYATYSVSSNSPKAVIQTETDINSYSSFQPGGVAPNNQGNISFGVFNPSIEGAFASGVAASVLDLFRIPNTGSPAGFVGTFTISSNATVTFHKPATTVATPTEPSISLAGGSVQFSCKGTPAGSYQVQRSTTLAAGGWTTLTTVPANGSGVVTYTDAAPPVGTAYYRAATP